jgi:hypothetical protein
LHRLRAPVAAARSGTAGDHPPIAPVTASPYHGGDPERTGKPMRSPQKKKRTEDFVPMPSVRMQWLLYCWAFGLPAGLAVLLFWLRSVL